VQTASSFRQRYSSAQGKSPQRCLCGGMLLIVALFLGAFRVQAAQSQTLESIHYDAANRVFRLDAADVTYVVGINQQDQVQTLYWGKRLASTDQFPPAVAEKGIASFDLPVNTTPQEYVAWGGGLYVESDLKVTCADGNRDLVLRYDSYSIAAGELQVRLRDIAREIYVTLHYSIDAHTGIMRRFAVIENRTTSALVLEQAAAATWNLPAGSNYRLRYLAGRWAAEWGVQVQPVLAGKTILESRRGTTGHQNNPWFAIDNMRNSDSEHGDTWFGALAWSGSWQIAVEQDPLRQVRVTGGYNPFDFGYTLQPGQSLETPAFYGGYSASGIGGASRLLHRFEVDSLMPGAPQPKLRPIVYNSWEATEFAVDEAGQMKLVERAARIGVERFVVDDGWFGQRNRDSAGLGDWSVNNQKFPHGLKPLIDRVHQLGMDFGLWVEPEMVNPDSDLYRAHPDWVLNFSGRPRSELRHQLVLNLARADVRAYVFHALDQLLMENQIAFLKWDYNRNWSEPGWPSVPPGQQKSVYVDFIRNYYSILDELRKKHPDVEIESCSGGGGRVDLGVLRYVDEFWTSDNTDAFDRLKIQNGFTYAYAPAVMAAWVTDSPTWVNHRSLSIDYRFLSSMQGVLGIGADLRKWDEADLAAAGRMIAKYKAIRATVQRGDLYRLLGDENAPGTIVNEFSARDGSQTVVFAFLHSSQEQYPYPRIHLQALDPAAIYDVEVIDGALTSGTPTQASGSYWMQRGLDLQLQGDFQAAGILLRRVPAGASPSSSSLQ